MMHSLILTPAQALWRPRARPRLVRAQPPLPSFLPPRPLPQTPNGMFYTSGDTLQVFTPPNNQPPSANYATFNTRNGHLVLEFDDTTQETAIFVGTMPRHYVSGNIVVYIKWMAKTAVAGTGGWGVTFERDADAGDDMDSDSFATEQIVTAATVPGSSGVIKATSVTCTAGAAGTDSVVAGDDFRLRVRRDVATDTAVGDLQLLSVELKEA